MKTLILGAGQMGRAIAHSMVKLGSRVSLVDGSEDALSKAKKFVSNRLLTNTYHVGDDIVSKLKFVLYEQQPDVVISSLPYFVNQDVAPLVIDNGNKYCDLGGRVDVSQHINDLASSKDGSVVFTDLGLAPGWVNIIAEHLVSGSIQTVTGVNMFVGGIPSTVTTNNVWNNVNHNPLNYLVTWSVDGLINEYRDDCIILKNGVVTTVKGMDGLTTVDTSVGKLEAFYTSGGSSHTIQSMMDRGVSNCSYRTLRYPGHRDMVQFLIKKCNLSNEVLRDIFITGCMNNDDNKDMVVIRVEIVTSDRTTVSEKIIRCDEKLSAMQRATSFPIASVAHIIGTGNYFAPKTQRALRYSDVTYDIFSAKMAILETK